MTKSLVHAFLQFSAEIQNYVIHCAILCTFWVLTAASQILYFQLSHDHYYDVNYDGEHVHNVIRGLVSVVCTEHKLHVYITSSECRGCCLLVVAFKCGPDRIAWVIGRCA